MQPCDTALCPQNAIVSVKELCGLPPIASLKQCLLTLSSRLITGDNSPSVSLVMRDTFPYLEPLGTIPDVQKRMLAAYDLVGSVACGCVCVCAPSRARPWGAATATCYQKKDEGSSVHCM